MEIDGITQFLESAICGENLCSAVWVVRPGPGTGEASKQDQLMMNEAESWIQHGELIVH